MKRKLKAVLRRGKRTASVKRDADKKFTSYDTSKTQTDTYQKVREERESPREMERFKKSKSSRPKV
ncbi:MAG TPA: hypothetical protein VGK59_19045 [Ohtaekwangia sp.]